MIRVDVEDYCQECLEFTPDVTSPIRIDSDDNKTPVFTDTVIQCKYRKRCANIVRYLKHRTESEASG